MDFAELQPDTSDCFEIVFARTGLTDEYNSIFTSIYALEGEDQFMAIGEKYTDYDQCDSNVCDDLVAPTSEGDVTVCDGDVLPAISVTEVEGQSVRWYLTPEGGVPIALGPSIEPPAAGIYYAEAFRVSDGCFSATRTAVALVVNPQPDLTILTKACLNDQGGYTLRINTNATSVLSDTGTVEKGIGNEWQITDIPDSTNVLLTLENGFTGCTRTESIVAPNCGCPLVSEPISGGDQLICLGDVEPILSVTVLHEDITVDWYSSVDGGTPLVTGQLDYSPHNINETGIYTYYAQARSLANDCISSTRTALTLTVLDPPIYAFINTDCTDDLQAYTALIYSDANAIEADFGEVENTGNGIWSISGVPSGSDLTLSILSQSGCIVVKQIGNPSCNCNTIEAPICNGVISACEGQDYDEFVAFVYKHQIVKWYDSETGGTLLATDDRFKPNLPGKYYVEAMDTITGCVSQERTEVELILNPVPDLQILTDVFCADQPIFWTQIVEDVNNTSGVLNVYASFRDALNDENAITEDSFIVNAIGSYFFRKTSEAGCFDIEIVIIIPEDCDEICRANAGTLNPEPDICFDGFIANLIAQEGIAATVPTGYVQAFLITEGDLLLVIGVH